MLYSIWIKGQVFYSSRHVQESERRAWWDGLILGMIIGVTFMGILYAIHQFA